MGLNCYYPSRNRRRRYCPAWYLLPFVTDTRLVHGNRLTAAASASTSSHTRAMYVPNKTDRDKHPETGPVKTDRHAGPNVQPLDAHQQVCARGPLNRCQPWPAALSTHPSPRVTLTRLSKDPTGGAQDPTGLETIFTNDGPNDSSHPSFVPFDIAGPHPRREPHPSYKPVDLAHRRLDSPLLQPPPAIPAKPLALLLSSPTREERLASCPTKTGSSNSTPPGPLTTSGRCRYEYATIAPSWRRNVIRCRLDSSPAACCITTPAPRPASARRTRTLLYKPLRPHHLSHRIAHASIQSLPSLDSRVAHGALINLDAFDRRGCMLYSYSNGAPKSNGRCQPALARPLALQVAALLVFSSGIDGS